MKNRIWRWFDDEFKAYCEENDDYRKIMSWNSSRHGSTYILPDGSVRHDVIIPRRLHNRAAKLLGVTAKVRTPAKVRKTPSQVVAGQRGSDSTAVSKRRLDSKGTSGGGALSDDTEKSGSRDWHRWAYGGARNPLLNVKTVPDKGNLPEVSDL